MHFQKNIHNTSFKAGPHSSAITWSLNRDLKLLLMCYIVKSVPKKAEYGNDRFVPYMYMNYIPNTKQYTIQNTKLLTFIE